MYIKKFWALNKNEKELVCKKNGGKKIYVKIGFIKMLLM